MKWKSFCKYFLSFIFFSFELDLYFLKYISEYEHWALSIYFDSKNAIFLFIVAAVMLMNVRICLLVCAIYFMACVQLLVNAHPFSLDRGQLLTIHNEHRTTNDEVLCVFFLRSLFYALSFSAPILCHVPLFSQPIREHSVSFTLFLSNEIVVVHLMMSARYFIDFFFLGQMAESALGKTIIIKTKTETTNRI